MAETKDENVRIEPGDYWQGESYARSVGAEFLVMHNLRETEVVRLKPGAPGSRMPVEDVPSAQDFADPRRLDALRRSNKPFARDEFRRLLFECHTILRDNHKMDPGTAFDEISKILFIKMHYERAGQHERFTTEFLDRVTRLLRKRQAELPNFLFDEAKEAYAQEELFEPGDRLSVTHTTFHRIVGRLERFNLSATSEDVKGLAFERFLGQTFRGDLGQFFTPRPIVDFMVEMLDPQEGDLVCDPACGTGGFLIKTFDYVRERIEEDIRQQKFQIRAALEQQAEEECWPEGQLEGELELAYRELNTELDPSQGDSRLGRLARSLFGADAEPRASRTAKMNMIMHGDGHGGIVYHDGLLDFENIFGGRFALVLTNPPFGSTVGDDQLVGTTEQTTVPTSRSYSERFKQIFGEAWDRSYRHLRRAADNRTPLLHLFDIGRDPVAGPEETSNTRPKRSTELLFVERAIDLVEPGGRIGIVLPEGVLNNPREAWFRRYVETRAKLLAVVSVPHEVFASADATVKTSLVFLQRLSEDEVKQWQETYDLAVEELANQADAQFLERLAELEEQLRPLSDDLNFDSAHYADAVLSTASSSVVGRLRRSLVKALPDATALNDHLKELEDFYKSWRREVYNQAHERACASLGHWTFMAEVEFAGITSTGVTGDDVPNQFPDVLKAYRQFCDDPVTFGNEHRDLVPRDQLE